MSLIINSGSISFDGVNFQQSDAAASKEIETKRSSDDGIPIKRLRAFGSASTFIDFNTSRRGAIAGTAIDIFVKNVYEAFHISPARVSIGPVPGVPIELTGSLNIGASQQHPHKLKGRYVFQGNPAEYGTAGSGVEITGSLTVSGSNTFTNWGNFRNRFKDKHHFTVTTDPTAKGGWREGLGLADGNAPHLKFQLSGSGQAGIGTLAPEHTLHVSASSANHNALYVEGTTIIKGFAGASGFGNPNILTGNTIIPAGYNVVLWTTNNNPSLTIPIGTNYTVAVGANIKMVNMDTAF
tara:strand:- start:866 stop:1750 length:885 start_codon:yes stop_codon:yes gene_type:complete